MSWHYGMGLLVRPRGDDANWFHFGELPGTVSVFVRTFNGFTWVALFNYHNGAFGTLSQAVDRAMWAACSTVETWPDYDLFQRM